MRTELFKYLQHCLSVKVFCFLLSFSLSNYIQIDFATAFKANLKLSFLWLFLHPTVEGNIFSVEKKKLDSLISTNEMGSLADTQRERI